jgi:hypothetical protein
MSAFQWATLALAGFSVGVAMWLGLLWIRKSRSRPEKKYLPDRDK